MTRMQVAPTCLMMIFSRCQSVVVEKSICLYQARGAQNQGNKMVPSRLSVLDEKKEVGETGR